MTLEEITAYGLTFLFCAVVVGIYLYRGARKSKANKKKIETAKAEGRFEPVSLHPYIDTDSCIGTGACVKACPEKDILGVIDGKATVINATSCIGHGACFHACPTEAISLRIGTESRGVELPHVSETFETNIPGIYIAGELGGMGLIRNSAEQGIQAVQNLSRKGVHKNEGSLDLAIIGAGPAGIAASLTARKLGLDFVILEQDSLGGTVFTFPRSKIVMTNPIDLPLYGKLKLVNTSKEELLSIWQSALSQNQIEIREYSKVESINQLEKGGFRLDIVDHDPVFTTQVLIAIGRRGSPRKLGVPGEISTKVAYRLVEPENIEGERILIVGGGDSAIESALLLMENNEVTLSYRQENFARIKPQNQKKIEEAIRTQKISTHLKSNVTSIEETKVHLETETGTISLPNDRVYIFAGGELPTAFLRNAGISIDKKFGKIVKSH